MVFDYVQVSRFHLRGCVGGRVLRQKWNKVTVLCVLWYFVASDLNKLR